MKQSISPTNSLPEFVDIVRPSAPAPERAHKMELMAGMAVGLAHDFNNMLCGVVGALEMMQVRIGQGSADEIGDLVQVAMASLRRATVLTHTLLALWRPQPLEMNLVCVNEVIESMGGLLRCTVGDEIEVKLALAWALPLIVCDQHQLENAILNMAINARDAMPDGGELIVKTSCIDQDGDEPGDAHRRFIGICVADTGSGMSPDVAARAFDLFYTTKRRSRGTGLGLAMVKCFVDCLGGQVKLQSAIGEGTAATIYLPTG